MEEKIIKIALCHLVLSQGPEEENRRLLLQAMEQAAQAGADWIITPEGALQGYYFKRQQPDYPVKVQDEEALSEFTALARKLGVYLFLGCGEHDAQQNLDFNSCLVINPAGKIQSRHRKVTDIKGLTEGWAAPAPGVQVTECQGIRVGVLVCADAWYDDRPRSLQEQGAQVIIDIAAWPPSEICGNPFGKWQQVSQNTGLPFVLCNQTGTTEWMDMYIGESVVNYQGKCLLTYQGDPGILLFSWDFQHNQLLGSSYEILPIPAL